MAERGLRGCAADFPILVNNPELHYLDTAASAQKPRVVIEAISNFYSNDYANVHRGSYELSQRATSIYEGARARVAAFLGLAADRNVIFTRGTTDGTNMVMQALARKYRDKPMSGVLVTRAEHHANFVPWQQLAKESSAPFLIAELDREKREVDLNHFRSLLSTDPTVVALSSSSNVLGTRHPWREMARMAKERGAYVFLDIAQSVAHDPIDLSKEAEHLDFVVFSGHKIFGPTGIGVLWAKESLLNHLTPTHFGGDMISRVDDLDSEWNEVPWKWEPGTPPIVEAVGLGAALDYMAKFSFAEIHQHEENLCSQVLTGLQKISDVQIYGVLDAGRRGPLVAFNLDGVHSLDLAAWLDARGLALRSGHHCAQPLHRALGVDSSLRASFSIYNSEEDVLALLEGVAEASAFFAKLRKKGSSAS